MPTDVGRALSIQQQYALELIASSAGAAAAQLMLQSARNLDSADTDALARQYATLLTGAMMAVAATRVGYLQRYAVAEGLTEFDVPMTVLRPTVQDVLVGGNSSPIPLPRGVGASEPPLEQTALRAPSDQGAVRAALARLEADLSRGEPDALGIASRALADYTDSTVTAVPDYVDEMLLGPRKEVAALRRVAHPGACFRCIACSGVLVFKTSPRHRHPQCRCSFEPVAFNDPEYQGRLARYNRNATQTSSNGPGGSAWARDTRYRGRQQLAEAELRRTEIAQDRWELFLKDEQVRLSKLVQTIPSDQYRNWAIMTAVKQTEVGGNPLPTITRN